MSTHTPRPKTGEEQVRLRAERARTNRRLIADMLAALQQIELLEWREGLGAAKNIARAVIAKAEGKVMKQQNEDKAQRAWQAYCKSGRKPDDIPERPDIVYAAEWTGWQDWLGWDMTADEAYQRGQRDMRDRIIKQWGGWSTDTIGGHHRAKRLGRKSYGNVAVEIRARCKVLPLARTAIAIAKAEGKS